VLHVEKSAWKLAQNFHLGAGVDGEQIALGSQENGKLHGSYQTPECLATKLMPPPAPRKHASHLPAAEAGTIDAATSEKLTSTPSIFQDIFQAPKSGNSEQSVMATECSNDTVSGSNAEDASKLGDPVACGALKPHKARCKRLSFSELLTSFAFFTPERVHTLNPPVVHRHEEEHTM
jgi:hypothetical protein